MKIDTVEYKDIEYDKNTIKTGTLKLSGLIFHYIYQQLFAWISFQIQGKCARTDAPGYPTLRI
jgi:hypothetical protein